MEAFSKDEFDVFTGAVAAKLATFLKEDKSDKPYISQRKAFYNYGEGVVRRWVAMGLITPAKRKGIVEYPTAILKELSRIKQDYFNVPTLEQRRIAKKVR